MSGDPDAPTAPWGRADSLGTDATSARGRLWGEKIAPAKGDGGGGGRGIGAFSNEEGDGLGGLPMHATHHCTLF